MFVDSFLIARLRRAESCLTNATTELDAMISAHPGLSFLFFKTLCNSISSIVHVQSNDALSGIGMLGGISIHFATAQS